MNNSGKAVKCLYEPRMDLVVIHDDLDLAVGKPEYVLVDQALATKGIVHY